MSAVVSTISNITRREGTKMLNLLRNEEGATAVEYGIMVAMIAAAVVVTVGLIGSQLNTVFTGVVTSLGG